MRSIFPSSLFMSLTGEVEFVFDLIVLETLADEDLDFCVPVRGLVLC